jgi:hypothetical protein
MWRILSPRGRPRPARYRPCIEVLEGRWLPSTLTVTSAADSGPGSLRAEIAAAQSGDTIVFAPSLALNIITLTSGELTINKSLTIDALGDSRGTVWINANNASRAFDVTSSSASVTLDNLVIEGGSAKDGGGLYNTGSLTLNNCILTGNVASGLGGAVDNKGAMVINNTSFGTSGSFPFFPGNQAANGGAIENQGSMTVTNSVFTGNVAANDGGAIDNRGNLTVNSCALGVLPLSSMQNYANSGGNIYNSGTLNVTGSTFQGGIALIGDAIANFGNATLDGCSLAGGQAELDGGGIYNAGTLSVVQSTLTGNRAGTGGGGIYNSGTLTLSATMVTGNDIFTTGGGLFAGGGIFNTGTLYVTGGSTVTGNTAQAGADLYTVGTVQISSDSTVGVIGP